MATEETRRGAPEEHNDALEALRRFFWGMVGVAIAFVLWIRFELLVDPEPEWLFDAMGMGLILGAYCGMTSFRGRRERAARGARLFAAVFIVVTVVYAIQGLFTG
jgi:uncharacterized membrane protein YfcA